MPRERTERAKKDTAGGNGEEQDRCDESEARYAVAQHVVGGLR